MFITNLIFWPYRAFQQCRKFQDDENLYSENIRVKFKPEDFESDKTEKPKKLNPYSYQWLMNWCGGNLSTLSNSINTLALFCLGFDLHRMQRRASSDPILGKHVFLGLNIPPIYFAKHQKVAREIYRDHRDQYPFEIDNGENSIFAFISDMLDDRELSPNDIIFTCSQIQTKEFKPFLNAALDIVEIKKQRVILHACAQEALDEWANEIKHVDITERTSVLVCDMMSRYFFGIPDKNKNISFSMNTFFAYIFSRFSHKTFDKDVLTLARKRFWEEIDRAVENKESVASKLHNLMREKGYTDRQVKMFLFSLFFAGIDSTTQSFGYAILKCAQNLDLQNSIRTELKEKQNQDKDQKDLHISEIAEEIVVIQKIIVEGLRMFPPVIGVTRVARENIQLVANCDERIIQHKITKGELISPSPNLIARCPLLFPGDPHQFNVERHPSDKPLTLSSLPWLPFGGGSNLCPGWRLYKQFIEIFLAEMATNYIAQADDLSEIQQTGSFINKLSKKVFINFEHFSL